MPTRPLRSYGSFCPVAQASEVVAQRWVPLILREIMVGYHRFNEIRRALPLISPSVLAQRLKALEAKSLQEELVLIEAQIAALERAKQCKDRVLAVF